MDDQPGGKGGKIYSSTNLSAPITTNNDNNRNAAGSTTAIIPDHDFLSTHAKGRVLNNGEVIFPQTYIIPSTPPGGGAPPPLNPLKKVKLEFAPKGAISKTGSSVDETKIKQEVLMESDFDPAARGGGIRQKAPEYVGKDIVVTRLIGDKKTDIVMKPADIQDVVNRIIFEFNEGETVRVDNVMKFLAQVAAAAGLKDVKSLYKSPKEILDDLPNGIQYVKVVLENQFQHSFKPPPSNPSGAPKGTRPTEISTVHTFTIQSVDHLNLAVQMALSPQRLGRIVIKEVIMAHIRDAFTRLRGFHGQFKDVQVGTLMNSSNEDLRNYFGRLVGLVMRQEQLRNGSIRQYNDSERRILVEISAAIHRLGKFYSAGEGSQRFVDIQTGNVGAANINNNSLRGPGYTFSNHIQQHF